MIMFIGWFAVQPHLVFALAKHPIVPEVWSNLSATINCEKPEYVNSAYWLFLAPMHLFDAIVLHPPMKGNENIVNLII